MSTPSRRSPIWPLLLVFFAIAGIVFGNAYRVIQRSRGNSLHVYSTLPEISLTDQDGKPYSLDRMRGHVSVVNFIFTSCPSACPLLSATMADLQTQNTEALAGVQFVSFSVDPETDTPPVLKDYAARYKADPSRWTFVTGQPESLLEAIRKGFKVAIVREKKPPPTDSPNGFAIVHGENFVLVDAQARIRGYYHRDPENLAKLVGDAQALVRNGAT